MWLVWPLLGISLLGFCCVAIDHLRYDEVMGDTFHNFFGRFEALGFGVLALGALLVASGAGRPLLPIVRRLIEELGRHPLRAAVLSTAVLAVASLVIYEAYPLSMDEYVPVFQAGLFAKGEVTARYPPALLPWLFPINIARTFFVISPTGAVISAYWPGFALLLTPFVALRAAWLLNPLLGGLALVAMAALARRLWGSAEASGWAMLLALSSPVFTVTAFSFYSMNAHLCLNLLFALLLTGAGTWMALAAGVVGSLALALHNPLPHVLFAAPFLVWLTRERKWRRLGALIAGYLPGVAVLVVGWYWYSAHLAAGGPAGAFSLGSLAAKMERLGGSTLALPNREALWTRLLEYLEVFGWSAPGLPLLALLGYKALPAGMPRRLGSLLAAAAVATLAVYFFFPLSQGHGWGYRHLHYAFGVLPVLAAGAAAPAAARPRWSAAVATLALVGLLAGNLARCAEVRILIDEQRKPVFGDERTVAFVDTSWNHRRRDWMRNGPRQAWVLASRGRDLDDRVARTLLADAAPIHVEPGIVIWQGSRPRSFADVDAELRRDPLVTATFRSWLADLRAPRYVPRVLPTLLERAPGPRSSP